MESSKRLKPKLAYGNFMRILVILNRGMGAGCLNIYGGVWAETPFLDALAAESLVCRHHFSETPDGPDISKIWLKALKAWGKSAPFRISILPKGGKLPRPSLFLGARELSKTLSKNALSKAIANAAHDELLLVEKNDLLWPWPAEFLATLDPGPALGEEDPEEEVGVLNPQCGPIDPLSSVARRLQFARAEILKGFDKDLEEIYEEVDKAWAGSPWALVVTADVGFGLGEMGHVGPDPSRPLAQEALQIPLVIHSPGLEPGVTVRNFTCHDSVAEWLSVAKYHRGTGIPELFGRPQHLAQTKTEKANWTALRDGHSTLIRCEENGQQADTGGGLIQEWYRQPEDWHEVNNLAIRETDACQTLGEALDKILNPGATAGLDLQEGANEGVAPFDHPDLCN